MHGVTSETGHGQMLYSVCAQRVFTRRTGVHEFKTRVVVLSFTRSTAVVLLARTLVAHCDEHSLPEYLHHVKEVLTNATARTLTTVSYTHLTLPTNREV